MLVGVDGVEDRILDGELQPRGEHDRPQHADRILEEPHVRIADAADHPRVQILEASDVVDDRERADVVEQRVDREVPAERVFFGRAVGVVALDEPIALPARVQVLPLGVLQRLLFAAGGIGGEHLRQLRLGRGRLDLAAERGNLDGLGAELDVGEPEAASDDPAVAKELLDLVRVRGRTDVEVLRPPAEQEIPHAPTHQIPDVIVLVEPVEDFESVRIDLAT